MQAHVMPPEMKLSFIWHQKLGFNLFVTYEKCTVPSPDSQHSLFAYRMGFQSVYK